MGLPVTVAMCGWGHHCIAAWEQDMSITQQAVHGSSLDGAAHGQQQSWGTRKGRKRETPPSPWEPADFPSSLKSATHSAAAGVSVNVHLMLFVFLCYCQAAPGLRRGLSALGRSPAPQILGWTHCQDLEPQKFEALGT